MSKLKTKNIMKCIKKLFAGWKKPLPPNDNVFSRLAEKKKGNKS